MITILTGSAVPASTLAQFREWLEGQWGHIDPFEGNHPNILVPSPLVAVADDSALAGGLAFSSFPKPHSSDIAVWINALFVSPQHRNKGIASQLVAAAEVEAVNNAVRELFVLSEFPGLYQKLGWRIVGLDAKRGETNLTKLLVGTPAG